MLDMMKSMGITLAKEVAEVAFAKIDVNGDGVSFPEFCSYLSKFQAASHKGALSEEDVELLHKLLDRSGTGEVTIDDFQSAFRSLGIQMSVGELNAFVREIDEDDSGAINLEELEKFLHKYTNEQ